MTRLLALELFGFKSFADRTRFEFPEGITVVVGPNGSGKSNVVDAIKWVLGEQSVRSLRGRDMTDVIFAGSVSRKPLNTAETSLIFDNTSRKLSVDADAVAITRRVYRSGENEYLVNGEISRLRDIRELFSGTGAATEAYSVIEQGRVDALLVASGRDRRAVFEEAAGITRFKARRGEALRRVERSEQNRQRLADIVGEVAARLETVRHQAARARRWQQMTNRLRALRLAAAHQDMASVDGDVARLEEVLAGLQAESAACEAQALSAAAQAEHLAGLEQESAPRLAELQSLLTLHKEQAVAAEAKLSLLRMRSSEMAADQARLADEAQTARRRHRTAQAAVGAAGSVADELAEQARNLGSQLDSHEQSAAGSAQSFAAAREQLALQTHTHEQLNAQREKLTLNVDRAVARGDESRRLATQARERLDAARRTAARLVESLATREGTVESLARRCADTVVELESAETIFRDRTVALEAVRRDLSGWEAKLESCRERQAMLEELAIRQEGLSAAARQLLAEQATQPTLPGMRGVVADLIEAKLEWAGLVDIALGTLSQGIVVDASADLATWLAEWSLTEAAQGILAAGGRLGFVAPAQLAEPQACDLASQPGVVGRLDLLLGAADGATGPTELLRRLLGHAWVVETLEDARNLLAQAPVGILVLTRAGGALAHGRCEVGTPTAATRLVTRRAELRVLAERQAELQRTVATTASAVDALEAEIATLRQGIRQLNSRRQQEGETLAMARAELQQFSTEHAAAIGGLQASEGSLLEAERQVAEAGRVQEAAEQALIAHRRTLDVARDQLAATQEVIDRLERDRGAVIQEVHRLRIEHVTCAERLKRAHDDVASRGTEAQERHRELILAASRLDESARRMKAFELELLDSGAEFSTAILAAERAADSLREIAESRQAIRDRRSAAATAAELARTASLKLSEAIHSRELEAGEARHRRARIVERIRDEYDVDMEAQASATALFSTGETGTEEIPTDRATLDADIDELKRKLGSMTTVNLEALAESEELSQRLATLQAQLDDVTGAKLAIEQLIAKIDDESRRLLGETIETVRGHFRELFERVFGGGQADIVLEPGVDLLEAAVEIVARPPGKEPRNISLLSGGEKTMTCVALLLAIFRSRPSPFCVLDEVDAALDEANVDRFVGVLRDFTGTQFIIVTHSKKTMAAATTLYGVTMEESGVSKRVSVRFEAHAASQRRAA